MRNDLSIVALSLGLSILACARLPAEENREKSASASVTAFRVAIDEDREATSKAVILGRYAITSEAATRLSEVYTLELVLNELRHLDWNAKRWDKENAQLTVQQRMDDYLQTAHDFYSWRGERGTGVSARRLEKYTDAECGDQQLSSALMTVAMAAMWQVPLDSGKVERLDRVLKKRIELIAARKSNK